MITRWRIRICRIGWGIGRWLARWWTRRCLIKRQVLFYLNLCPPLPDGNFSSPFKELDKLEYPAVREHNLGFRSRRQSTLDGWQDGERKVVSGEVGLHKGSSENRGEQHGEGVE